jgi:hypothetical protein
VAAIELLATPGVWIALELIRTDWFQWLPSMGGLVRDVAYDLLTPLAVVDDGPLPNTEPKLQALFDELAQHGTLLVVVDQPARRLIDELLVDRRLPTLSTGSPR